MTSANNAYVGGALDLSQVKARAEARQKAQESPHTNASGVQPFFTVTESNFEQDVVRRSAEVPVVVLIGTARSTQSEQLRTDLQDLAMQGNLSFLVAYVDADATPQVAQVFGVKNLPTVVALGAGQPLTNFEGAQPKDALKQWVETLVQNVGPQLKGLQGDHGSEQPQEEEEDPRLQEAESFLNAGDFDGALNVYNSILDSEPDNVQIKQARDTTILLKRLDPANQTDDPIAAAEGDKEDVDKQMRAADAEVVAGAPEKAFERLIETMKATAGDKKAQVRERLLELFGLFDANDPRVLEARTKLASALY
ncbi:tetratricopeptide repeat protein [Corynebacterium tuberculostearicum]|uniref:tetratricopeptide repeat protein n=1 Tax=Corynebacterium tuberculostearicum TaxID=38304 RepID=UPI0026476532|nr:tetratricopeptide repeat protein [Corynebacterium tuberculostearicum]WKE58135.1 tetratricopeptide repeat protein [Corynebacterium tuberculostearicum]WKE59645.1 tetratricopeptide repeat protein [Corynebacterium tuberculostearicum]